METNIVVPEIPLTTEDFIAYSEYGKGRVKHHAMKICGGNGSVVLLFLVSALDGGGWSASRPNRFTSKDRAPGTYCWEAGSAPEPDWTL
jgi:hypothetical protein